MSKKFRTNQTLSDAGFNQPSGSGSTLSVSGNTTIANGGTLKYGICQHSSFTNRSVVDKEYVDKHVSGATGSSIYNLSSPAAITVGGITGGTILTGKSTIQLFEMLLVPELFQTSVGTPTTTVGLSFNGTCEIGYTASQTITPTYTAGAVTPLYCSTSPFCRGGAANDWSYTGPSVSVGFNGCTSCNIPSYSVTPGVQTWCVCTKYNVGSTIKSSKGTTNTSYVPNPMPLNSCTAYGSASVTGIYPYFWGLCTCPGPSGANRPTANCAMVLSGTKVVANSAGDISINFNAISGNDYIWFAVPSSVTDKTCWCCNSSLYGAIGGGISAACNLFPAPVSTVSVISTTPPWTCDYDVYISNKQTATATLKMGYA